MNTLLRLSLMLALHCLAPTRAAPLQTKILFTKALVYDAVIEVAGLEVKSYLSQYNSNFHDVDDFMSLFEEQAVDLCANAVMEFTYSNYGEYGLRGSGVAVCDPRLG